MSMILMPVAVGLPIDQTRARVGTGSLIPGRTSGPVQTIAGEDPADQLTRLPAADSLVVSRTVAACNVRRDPAKVRAFLDAATANQPEQTVSAMTALKPVMERCLGDARKVSTMQMRMGYKSALAFNSEAYILAHQEERPEAITTAALFDDPGFQQLPSGVDKTSFCLAATDPAGSATILKAEPGSDAESRAVGTAVPAISACTDTGTKMAMNKTLLRLNLAFHYYRLSRMHANASAGKN
jgi:hypothetical protein